MTTNAKKDETTAVSSGEVKTVEAPNGTESVEVTGKSDVSAAKEATAGNIIDPTPVERAVAKGQRDVIDPQVATGQTPNQIAAELVPPDSNDELRKAADKRANAALVYGGEPANRRAPETTKA